MNLSDGIEQLAGYLRAGQEAQLINTATERLLSMGKYKGLLQTLALTVYERGTITLPAGYETMIGCRVGGAGQYIHDPWYSVIPKPSGWYSDPRLVARDLEDGYVLYKALPTFTTKFRVVFDAADAAKKFSITARKGVDQGVLESTESFDDETLADGVEGFLTTSDSWGDVTVFLKERTTKPVSLEAYDDEQAEWVEVGRYAPKDTEISLRKYAIPTAKEGDIAIGLCKKRFVPMDDDSDIMPVDSIYSLRLALEALTYESEGSLKDAIPYWNLARKALDDALSEHRGSAMRTVPVFYRAAAGSKLRSFR